VAENVLDRDFAVERADIACCGDITYIWTTQGWLYLAVIMDLCTRRILGWSTAATLHRSLVLDALGAALKDRRPARGLIHHSDRGSQYASHDYREELEKAGATCSMSRKGNCWDNAPAESFFATLKQELIYQTSFETRSEANRALFEFIEVWYNRERLHSSLGYMTPVGYETMIQHQSTNQASVRESGGNSTCCLNHHSLLMSGPVFGDSQLSKSSIFLLGIKRHVAKKLGDLGYEPNMWGRPVFLPVENAPWTATYQGSNIRLVKPKVKSTFTDMLSDRAWITRITLRSWFLGLQTH